MNTFTWSITTQCIKIGYTYIMWGDSLKKNESVINIVAIRVIIFIC